MVPVLPKFIAESPPPPGPFRRKFWRSPIRGPWLTAVFGLILLVGVTVMFLTGLLSWIAYNPALGHNDPTPHHGILGFFFFDWPTHPAWLYRFTQGLHVTLGFVLVPVLLAKLWSVIPKLFEWPPVKTPAQALERLSLLTIVGGAVFEFVTGILNVQYWYVFPGSFYQLHLYGAWVFIGGFVTHVIIKWPKMRAALKRRRIRDELKIDLAHTEPEPAELSTLVATHPSKPTISRRGALGLVGAGSLTLLIVTVGESISGPLRRVSALAPRDLNINSGPNGFQINKRSLQVGVTPDMTGPSWQLSLVSSDGSSMSFSRAQLLAMPQRTATLPIACVEGWSTGDQVWTGIPLAELAKLAGTPDPSSMYVDSLQPAGEFAAVTLRGNQVTNPDSLLALMVNGVDLSPDHGYPARIIVPANPGVHNTKWVSSLTFYA